MDSTHEIVTEMGAGKPVQVTIDLTLEANDDGELFAAIVHISAGGARQQVGRVVAADYGAAHSGAAALASTVISRYSIVGRTLGRGGSPDDADPEAI